MSSEPAGHVLKSNARQPHLVLRIVVPVIIVAAAVWGAVRLVKTAPKPMSRPPGERVSVVEIQPLARTRERVVLHTTGTVIPRRAVTLQARVAGPVVAVAPDFIPGGHFQAGDVMLEIDPADYALAVTNRTASLVKAQYDLAVEEGMQAVARHEWDAMQALSGDRTFTDLERQLALREPHLRLARGNLAAAEALLAQARLDLERTKVRAPFNAVIRERHVDIGAQVSLQTPLVELVETDAYWVRITLPVSQARWVTAADEGGAAGAVATVSAVPGTGVDGIWHGSVLRKLPELETAGRQALYLVEIPHPDRPDEGSGALIPGTYVRVRIDGPVLDEVFAIPRRAVHDGDTVWIMNAEKRLEIRTIAAAWSDDERVLVRQGVTEGETLVLSDINTPLSGMLLTTVEEQNRQQNAAARQSAGEGTGARTP